MSSVIVPVNVSAARGAESVASASMTARRGFIRAEIDKLQS
jgi:hypothetical protein